MKLYRDIWNTMYNEDFNNERYLYHYTSVNKAIKILYGNCLKFSKLNNLNDTVESKPKMSHESFSELNEFKKAFDYFRKISNESLQLLCFSKDSTEHLQKSADLTTALSDFSGRGFALPRMWAQYADNNNGVCLIFDREKLKSIIGCFLGPLLVTDNDVQYVNNFTDVCINLNEINNLLELNERIGNKNNEYVLFLDFVKSNMEFTLYNYFTKFDDWEKEKEYRFLALGKDDYFVKNISKALAGIVVGENIDAVDQSIIFSMSKTICDVMKINFSFKGCSLQRIYE